MDLANVNAAARHLRPPRSFPVEEITSLSPTICRHSSRELSILYLSPNLSKVRSSHPFYFLLLPPAPAAHALKSDFLMAFLTIDPAFLAFLERLATVLGLTPCVSKSRTAPVWAYYRYSRRAVICWECVLKRNVDRRRAFGVEIALALLAKTHISGHPLLHQAIAHSLLDEVKALRAAFPHPPPVHQARQQLPPAEDEDDMDVFACGYQEDQPVNPDDAALDEVKRFLEVEGRSRSVEPRDAVSLRIVPPEPPLQRQEEVGIFDGWSDEENRVFLDDEVDGEHESSSEEETTARRFVRRRRWCLFGCDCERSRGRKCCSERTGDNYCSNKCGCDPNSCRARKPTEMNDE